MRSLEKLVKNYIKRYPLETSPFDILKFFKIKIVFQNLIIKAILLDQLGLLVQIRNMC